MDQEPLVTICIPTYQRPEYFREALESVLHRTCRNLDVFLTDDSADDRTEQLIQPYLADGRITYEHHTEYRQKDNFDRIRAYDNPEAEYVGWLMDDDRFLPDKISAMVDAFQAHPDVVLVTSYRHLIDENGKLMPEEQQPTHIATRNCLLDGQTAGNVALTWVLNYIGEPSTTLMRKSAIENHQYEWIDIKPEYDCIDVPMWMNLLQKGNLYYFAQPLSEFRIHGKNQQMDPGMQNGTAICWAQLIEHAWQTKQFLRTEQDLSRALRNLLDRYLGGYLQEWFYSLPEGVRKDYEAVMGRAMLQLSKLSDGEVGK